MVVVVVLLLAAVLFLSSGERRGDGSSGVRVGVVGADVSVAVVSKVDTKQVMVLCHRWYWL